MFILDQSKFNDYNLSNAKQFVEFWSAYYVEDTTKVFNSNEVISYIEELNLQNNLTEANVKRLLRWKDPRMLTEEILAGPNKGKENNRVMRVIAKIEDINKFRRDEIPENSFKEVVNSIFPGGIIWQIFLFHIARPFEYPIADRYVFLAFSTQRQKEIPKDWEGYRDYKDYFFEVALSGRIIDRKPDGNEHDIKEIVSKLKKVDNALFAFGAFVNYYGASVKDLPLTPAQILGF
ncbi:MAG: hypothetical protein A4E65_00164 [Syntrophorhabdus sp. PtaU1.Bin153]|nr:MAG: hypothetical protein A4E65_00164 [Syntrophorhabdus sp. PtaU1.Bin153]